MSLKHFRTQRNRVYFNIVQLVSLFAGSNSIHTPPQRPIVLVMPTKFARLTSNWSWSTLIRVEWMAWLSS